MVEARDLETPAEAPIPPTLAIRRYWSSIPLGLRVLLVVESAVLAGSVGVATVLPAIGRSIPQAVTEVELFVLAFTVIVLTLLTEFTTRRSSSDVHSLVDTVRSESRSLIAENKAHWAEQRNHFEGFLKTLSRLIDLQVDLIAAVKRLDDAQRATMTSHENEMKAREEALRAEIEKHRPLIDIRLAKWEGKVWKHFLILVYNHGPPGVDLDVTFSLEGQGSSEHFPMVSQGSPCEKDFGDINNFSDGGEIVVICEVSSGTRSHRYRFQANYDYARNKGFWGSKPVIARKSPQVLSAETLY